MTAATEPVAPELAPPVRMIDPRMPKWRRIQDLDDLQAEASRLAMLLEVAFDILKEGEVTTQGEKALSVVIVAQGMAEYLSGSIELLHHKAGKA